MNIFIIVLSLRRFGNHVNHYTKSGDMGALVRSRHMRSSRFDGMRVAAYKVECQQQVMYLYYETSVNFATHCSRQHPTTRAPPAFPLKVTIANLLCARVCARATARSSKLCEASSPRTCLSCRGRGCFPNREKSFTHSSKRPQRSRPAASARLTL